MISVRRQPGTQQICGANFLISLAWSGQPAFEFIAIAGQIVSIVEAGRHSGAEQGEIAA
jgi:hypothetical protein